MQSKRLPIGYYLKLADSVLTKGIDDIQAQHGLDRISWQVLNSIYENSNILEGELLKLMQPFADKHVVESILVKFIDEGKIGLKDNRLVSFVTAEIMSKRLQSIGLFEKYQDEFEFRSKAMAGIPNEDYQTTISTLEKLIANLS